MFALVSRVERMMDVVDKRRMQQNALVSVMSRELPLLLVVRVAPFASLSFLQHSHREAEVSAV